MSGPKSAEKDIEASTPDEQKWLEQIRRHEDTLRNIAESKSPDAHIAQAMLEWANSENPTAEALQNLVARKSSDEDFGLARTPGVFGTAPRVERLLSRVSE